MPIRYLLVAFSLLGAGLLAAVASESPSMAGTRARLDVVWRVERGDYTYRLRGRYSMTRVSDEFATSVASDQNLEAATSHVYVPAGLYRVALEAGYTLERSAALPEAAPETSDGAGVEVVPASLVSPNPVIVVAKEGRIAAIGLSLVDLPGTAAEPAPTCMGGA